MYDSNKNNNDKDDNEMQDNKRRDSIAGLKDEQKTEEQHISNENDNEAKQEENENENENENDNDEEENDNEFDDKIEVDARNEKVEKVPLWTIRTFLKTIELLQDLCKSILLEQNRFQMVSSEQLFVMLVDYHRYNFI